MISGVVDSGVVDSGVVDSGVVDSGVVVSGVVDSGVEGDSVVGTTVVVVSLVVFFVAGTVAVGLVGAQVGEAVGSSGRLFGGEMRRYLGGGPGRLRRLAFGQLCRAHSDLDRGLVVRSQVFLGARTPHVTMRERTLPPHVTGHCKEHGT